MQQFLKPAPELASPVSFCWIVGLFLCYADAVDSASLLNHTNSSSNSSFQKEHHQEHIQKRKYSFLNDLKGRMAFRSSKRRFKRQQESSSSLDIPIITDPSLSYELHPSTALLLASERRKLFSPYFNEHSFVYNKTNITIPGNDSDVHYQTWFAPEQNAAVYATIPDVEDPAHIDDQPLQDFYSHRHLSRYERLYRTKHEYDMQYNWSGFYDIAFLDRILQFDSSNETNYHGKQTKLIPHRKLEQTEILSSSSNSIISNGGIFNNYQAVPLSQGYGTHFANVWVGTPTPQRKTVIVDTGSHYTAFPCTGCIKCGAPHHTDPYFRPENSKTFQQLQCNECQDGVVCENSKWYVISDRF